MYREGPAQEALRRALVSELELVGGSTIRAAKRWGVSESTMKRHLRRFGLSEFAARLREEARKRHSISDAA
jgi:transposase